MIKTFYLYLNLKNNLPKINVIKTWFKCLINDSQELKTKSSSIKRLSFNVFETQIYTSYVTAYLKKHLKIIIEEILKNKNFTFIITYNMCFKHIKKSSLSKTKVKSK